jgi:hypothetical protein
MPYQRTDVSLIPSASINPDFFNKAFQIDFTLQDWTLQNNYFFNIPADSSRLLIETNGVIRFVRGSALALGNLTGSNIGDRMRIFVDLERGNGLVENLTQNKCVNQQTWLTPLSMSYSDVQWLYFNTINPGMGSGSWNIYAPDLNIGY